jgi:hypothetical protein
VLINISSFATAVSRAPQNMTIREGETALFQCLVPDADVTMWRKDGDLVSQGPRKRVSLVYIYVGHPCTGHQIKQEYKKYPRKIEYKSTLVKLCPLRSWPGRTDGRT